jgi:hypothetical protein
VRKEIKSETMQNQENGKLLQDIDRSKKSLKVMSQDLAKIKELTSSLVTIRDNQRVAIDKIKGAQRAYPMMDPRR